MGWKNLSSWLKGGLIGVVVEVIAIIILSTRKCDYTEMIGGGWCAWSFDFIVENTARLFNEDVIVKIIFLGFLVAGFIIGAVIGWIVGKVRKRNVSKIV